MSYSVIKFKCNQCNEEHCGVLYDIYYPEKQYFAECPVCKNHTFFYGVTGIIDSEIPDNAVNIMNVARL